MSSRATSLEAKSQTLTQGENVNPCPQKKTKRRKIPNRRKGESKKEKFPIEEWEKAKTKEGKKIPDQRSEENTTKR